MSNIPKKALAILTEDEKSAVTLQHVHGKSSWEAGEMLGRSHYKYLEIRYRAERFLKIFSDHFTLFGDKIVPDALKQENGGYIRPDFEEYLELTMRKRYRVKLAAASIDSDTMEVTQEREAMIIEQMLKLKTSSSSIALNLYSLIMEFDRYNNFRILPRQIQEPSAFKRRNSTRYKKHLKIATSIPMYALKRLREICGAAKHSKNVAYIAIMNKEHPDLSAVVKVTNNQDNLKILTSLSMYVFLSKEDADEFYESLSSYISQETKDPREGLKFWPTFRNLIKKAINHDEINNIAPTRKSLEVAMKDMDTFYQRAANKRKYNQKMGIF